MIASTPKPPYFAVIFTSVLSNDTQGYDSMSEQMITLAKTQAGFLGLESARNEVGITVSYWDSLESIRLFKADLSHQQAQQSGRDQWYRHYKVRIAKVERDYLF